MTNEWNTCDNVPTMRTSIRVKGGYYDSDCQLDGFELPSEGELCIYNAGVSPPWIVIDTPDSPLRVRNPTHWKYETTTLEISTYA